MESQPSPGSNASDQTTWEDYTNLSILAGLAVTPTTATKLDNITATFETSTVENSDVDIETVSTQQILDALLEPPTGLPDTPVPPPAQKMSSPMCQNAFFNAISISNF